MAMREEGDGVVAKGLRESRVAVVHRKTLKAHREGREHDGRLEEQFK
jgi:hypothetical protein